MEADTKLVFAIGYSPFSVSRVSTAEGQGAANRPDEWADVAAVEHHR